MTQFLAKKERQQTRQNQQTKKMMKSFLLILLLGCCSLLISFLSLQYLTNDENFPSVLSPFRHEKEIYLKYTGPELNPHTTAIEQQSETKNLKSIFFQTILIGPEVIEKKNQNLTLSTLDKLLLTRMNTLPKELLYLDEFQIHRTNLEVNGEENEYITVILNVISSSSPPSNLKKQLIMILQQKFAHPDVQKIKEIWVNCFNSAHSVACQQIVRKIRKQYLHTETGVAIHLTTSSCDFTGHGRFLLASMVKTKYILMIDDESTINQFAANDFLTLMARRVGVWGRFGHVHGLTVKESRSMDGYKNGIEVDYISKIWFFQHQWLKVYLKEPISTFNTGEGIHLSYTVRKYLGINSYIYPIQRGHFSLVTGIKPRIDRKKRIIKNEFIRSIVGKGAVIIAKQPIKTIVFAQTPSDVIFFINRIKNCERQKQDNKLKFISDCEDYQKSAILFTGKAYTKELRILGEKLCDLTSCGYKLSDQFGEAQKIVKYFNMNMGIRPNGQKVPLTTEISEFIPNVAGVLKNIQPHFLVAFKPRNNHLESVQSKYFHQSLKMVLEIVKSESKLDVILRRV